MKALFAYEDRQFSEPIAYAGELLLSALDLDARSVAYDDLLPGHGADVLVTYGQALPAPAAVEAARAHLHIVPSGFFGPGFLCPCSVPTGEPTLHAGVPVLFAGRSPAVTDHPAAIPGRLVTTLDLIASTLYLASRYEEFMRPERDEFGRFETRSAYTYRHGYGDRPLVEEYVGLLQGWLRELGLPIERRRMLRDHEFAVVLTHDLDQLTLGWLESIFFEVRQFHRPHRSLYNIVRILADKTRGHDPYWSFDAMLGLEERRGVRSSLYFLERTGQRMDARYDWHQDRFGPLFKRLRAGGWEVGLHGSYDSAGDERMLAGQRRRLEEASGGPVVGVRQHYLRFLVQDGWRRQQEAGFQYDTTLGFADDVGFRGGLARPFQPFDLIARRKLDLWEVPLVAMDQTFRTYLGLPLDQVWERILPVLERVKTHRGAAAILWHNTFFAGYKFAGYEKVYERIIDWVQANGGTCTSAQAIVAQWARR